MEARPARKRPRPLSAARGAASSAPVVVKVRKLNERRGWAWSLAVAIVKPTLLTATKHEWIDGEKIPAEGGCVIAMNHVSHIDPLTLAWLLYEHGRLVRYLAKDALFRTPVLKYIVRDGVTREGAPGRLYNATGDAEDAAAFLDRSEKDPHQFRFVVSADD